MIESHPKTVVTKSSIGVWQLRFDRTCDEIENCLHMKRCLAIFPNVPHGHVIHDLRARFDPLAALAPPHLTLVFPFENTASDRDLGDDVKQSIQGLKPFAVSLSGICGHEGEYLILKVKQGNDQLIELHDRLYGGRLLRPHRPLFHTYIPHMTVGRIADKIAFTNAVAAASTQDTRFDLWASQITIETIGNDGVGFHASVIDLA